MDNAERPAEGGTVTRTGRPGAATSLRRTAARVYATAGAVAFAASLAYFACVYGIRLGAAGAESGDLASGLIINIGLFTAFALHHSLLARSGARRWVAGHLPPGLERATYVWVASILFALTCAWWQPLPGRLYSAAGIARAAGFAAEAAGIVLVVRAAAVLDLAELAGIRQAVPRGGSGGSGPPELRIRGPYRRVRHPLYLGLILIVIGAPDMTYSRLSFALLSMAYIVAAIPWEEREMARSFGDGYRRYRAQVPWRLVPGIY